MRLRAATTADLPALLDLERACFPPAEAFDAALYRHALARAHAVNLLVEDAGDVVAFGGAFLHAGHRLGNVFTLNVRPSARRRGHGRRLLAALEDAMREEGMTAGVLEVGVGNHAAIALYETAGYIAVERIPDYYPTRPRAAFRMVKKL